MMADFNVSEAGNDLLRDEANRLIGMYEALEAVRVVIVTSLASVRDRLVDVQAELGKRQYEAAVVTAMVSAPKPKVYLFVNGGMGTMIGGDALAEDGAHLGSHCSSNETWLKHDLGLTSNWHHEAYREHYPEGYKVEWVDDPAHHKGVAKAYQLNQEYPQPEPEPFVVIETDAGTVTLAPSPLPPPANAPVGACG